MPSYLFASRALKSLTCDAYVALPDRCTRARRAFLHFKSARRSGNSSHTQLKVEYTTACERALYSRFSSLYVDEYWFDAFLRKRAAAGRAFARDFSPPFVPLVSVSIAKTYVGIFFFSIEEKSRSDSCISVGLTNDGPFEARIRESKKLNYIKL